MASTKATRAEVWYFHIWGQQCGPLGEAGGCMLPLLASFVPHVVWNMNEPHYSDCAIERFADVLLLTASMCLSRARGCPGFPSQISVPGSVQGSVSPQITALASWNLRETNAGTLAKPLVPVPLSLSSPDCQVSVSPQRECGRRNKLSSSQTLWKRRE